MSLIETCTSKNLKVYDKETSRPYCHVKDFARLINMILKTKKIKKHIFKYLTLVGILIISVKKIL